MNFPMTSRSGGRLLTAFLILAALPFAAQGAAVEEIFNHHAIDATLTTSGQVLPEHVAALEADGFGLVVNLAVADEERNGHEDLGISGEGITYVHIPVDWETPSFADLELFFAVMDARGDRRTLVHCFANFRGAAFTYLYRTLRAGVPEAEARADFEAIWTEERQAEYPQWGEFIAAAQARYGG